MQSHREELSTLLRQDSEDEEMVVVTTVKPVGQTSLHTKPPFFSDWIYNLPATRFCRFYNERDSSLKTILCFILIITVDVAVYLYLIVVNTVPPTHNTLMYDSLYDLKYGDTYIGLDDLYHSELFNKSRYSPFINSPRMIAQVSAIEQQKVFPQDGHWWYDSTIGTISPLDRHLVVSKHVSLL